MTGRRYRLTQRRRDVGLSQEALAEAIGVDRSTVVRWERADTDPQPWHRPRLAEALRISIDELATLLARPERPTNEPSPIDVLVTDRSDDLETLRSFRQADRQVGGGYLYATVVGYLQRSVAPRLFGPTLTSGATAVFVAAAALTEMAGWMAHDAGRDTLAEQHFQRAYEMAMVGRAKPLAAHICASLSHLASYLARSEAALTYAARGHGLLNEAARQPDLEARLHAMTARGYAASNRADECLDHLDSAERALGMTPEQPRPTWASAFDQAALAVEGARCLQRLGRLRAAESQATLAMQQRPPERIRGRAHAQVLLASILIGQRRLDDACHVVSDVVTATSGLSSTVVAHHLEDIRRQLAPFERSAAVASTVGVLDGELRERRWLVQCLPPDTDSSGEGSA